MKLGPVTKLDKRNMAMSKNDDDVISANCDVIAFFPIYGQFPAIRKTYSGRTAYKTYILNNYILILILHLITIYKNYKQN